MNRFLQCCRRNRPYCYGYSPDRWTYMCNCIYRTGCGLNICSKGYNLNKILCGIKGLCKKCN